MRPVLYIAIKDLRLLVRDRAALFFTLVFPIIFGLGFGFIMRGVASPEHRASVHIGVVDQDGSALSAAFVEELLEVGSFDVRAFASAEEAEAHVRAGRLPASITIPAGFAAGLEGIFAGARPRIEGLVDPSRSAESAMIAGALRAAVYRTIVRAMSRPEHVDALVGQTRAALAESELPALQRAALARLLSGVEALPDAQDGSGAMLDEPVAIALRHAAREAHSPRSPFEITWPQAAAWALVGCVTGFGLSLVGERSHGTILRLASSPIPRWSVVAGKGLGCFTAALTVLVALRLVFMLPFFHVRAGSPGLEALAIVSIAFGFVGVMMLLASLTRSERGAEGFVRAMLLVMALLGGAGVPLFLFTGWVELASRASPFRWAIMALEQAGWRGGSFADVAGVSGVLLAIGLVGLAGGSWIHARRAAA